MANVDKRMDAHLANVDKRMDKRMDALVSGVEARLAHLSDAVQSLAAAMGGAVGATVPGPAVSAQPAPIAGGALSATAPVTRAPAVRRPTPALAPTHPPPPPPTSHVRALSPPVAGAAVVATVSPGAPGSPVPVPPPAVTHAHATPPPHAGSSVPCVVDAAPCVAPASGRLDPSTFATDPRFTTEYPPSRVPWTDEKWDELLVPAHHRLAPKRALALVFQVDSALLAGCIAPHVVVGRVLECLPGGHRLPVCQRFALAPRRSWLALRRALLETVGYPVTWQDWDKSLRNTRPKAGESFQAFEQRVRDLCDTAQRLGHPVTTVEVLLRRKWSGGFTAT